MKHDRQNRKSNTFLLQAKETDYVDWLLCFPEWTSVKLSILPSSSAGGICLQDKSW